MTAPRSSRSGGPSGHPRSRRSVTNSSPSVGAPRAAAAGGRASRRRRRGISTKLLVFIAATACLALLIGRGSAQVVSTLSCTNSPLYLKVAVSPDIAPAVQRIADLFNEQRHETAGQCIRVEPLAEPSMQATAQVDGTHQAAGQDVDAWIPNSSLWVDEARGFAVGATTVQPSGISVARSPLMLVMPNAAAAAKVPGFTRDGWRLLLPRSAGGPPAPKGLKIDLPDPTQSAAGLSALIEIGRLLGTTTAARVKLARFVLSPDVTVTSDFDDPVSLRYFAGFAAPPLDELPVTITTEQAVLAYDAANPREPLAGSYPAGHSVALGSPEFDYPYVLTTSNPQRYAAAKVFGQMLTTGYARSVLRYAGFRSGSGAGVTDQIPASYGLADQLLQVATPASASEAPTALQAWNALVYESRDLVLIDTSTAMDKPADAADPTGPTLEQELTATASIGLALFASGSNLGLWEFAADLHGDLPYRQLVPIGPLSANLGVISRRSELQKISAGLRPDGGSQVALYGSILAAYKYMERTYRPKYFNAVVVLASGDENAPGDITGAQLAHKLQALADPSRKVALIIITFGSPPNFPELRKIAGVTGGQAFQITSPDQVAKVFFRALAHRLCDPNCVAA